MKININANIEIESKEDLLEAVGIFGTALFTQLSKSVGVENKTEESKAETKQAAEKPKKNKVEDKPKVEDTKEETPKVEAEVTGVDTNSEEPTKDAEVKEENTDGEIQITKEMVREKFNQVVKSGKQKEAKALIESLGAKKLSDVEPENYATLIEKAEALL